MNYRHAYHAGGIADVFKHIVLIALLDRLKQKESAFLALDTHAGIGLYDLGGEEALKTGEFRSGIATLREAPVRSPLLVRYLALVKQANPEGGLRFYPGSPLLIAQNLRAQDRGTACELHEEDFPMLRHSLKPYGNMTAHHRSGYEALGAFLPPPERRGLILIDPPFESPGELADTAAALVKAYVRFAQGAYALWYPIKERPTLWRFQDDIMASGIKRQLAIEFLTQGESDSRRLNGSGLLLINPPYRLEEDLQATLEELRAVLAPDGKVVFTRLAGE